jgi:hypothetical protein
MVRWKGEEELVSAGVLARRPGDIRSNEATTASHRKRAGLDGGWPIDFGTRKPNSCIEVYLYSQLNSLPAPISGFSSPPPSRIVQARGAFLDPGPSRHITLPRLDLRASRSLRGNRATGSGVPGQAKEANLMGLPFSGDFGIDP